MTIELPPFVSGKRKYLFCGSEKGLELLSPLYQQGLQAPFEIISLRDKELSEKLSNQKMGTFLYVAATWEELSTVKKLANEIGYSDAEVYFVGYGDKYIQLFCCRCHGMMKIKEIPVNSEVTCRHCQLLLSVSDHYSKQKDAYLGYVAKI